MVVLRQMSQQKTVLVAPMNWGLGHATRLVPVIEALMEHKTKVILAADKRPYDFLRLRFPECDIVRLPGFEPVYPGNRSLAVQMLLSFPKMMKCARTARRALQKIIEDYRIDMVISDNRYELYSPKAYSVFITHQLNIQTRNRQKIFKPLITRFINRFIRKYDELWIPDYEDLQRNLSGALSHLSKYPLKNYHFTGPLSRFKLKDIPETEHFDLLVILSGPEPQRTIFEKIILDQVSETDLKTVVLQGKPEKKGKQEHGNVTLIPHTGDREMAGFIQSAPLIISRPGYSTVMDMTVFGKKAIFIPTPGQTEQEYLARQLEQAGYAYFEEQKSFNLKRAVEKAQGYKGLPKMPANNRLKILTGDLPGKIQTKSAD